MTRVLVVPRAVSFRDLAARLTEMAGGAEVRAVRHRLADTGLEDVIVTVTCDEELAHMRDAPRGRARPSGCLSPPQSLPDLEMCSDEEQGSRTMAPRMRRVQSEQALAVSGQFHRRPAHPAPMRRVQSAQEFRLRQLFHQRSHQCRGVCQRQDVRAPALPARPMSVADQVASGAGVDANPHSRPA
ncbi:hypothetical protein EJB05_05097, partial [Eragrostis curvula]